MEFSFSRKAFADAPQVGTQAVAPQAGAPVGGAAEGIMSFLPLILIVVVFYFLVIRPQSKRMKQHRDTIAALRKGDRVLTAGGIYGTIVKLVDDTEAVVEIADNVEIRVARATIADVISKPEPVKDVTAIQSKKTKSK